MVSDARQYSESIELLNLSFNVMCQIWKAKNACYFNQDRLEPNDIVSKPLFDYHEYREILATCSSTSSQK